MITPGKASAPIPPDVPRRGFSMRHAATSAWPRDPRCVADPEAVRRLHRAGRKRNLEHPDLRSGHGAGDPPDHQARARQYVSMKAPNVGSRKGSTQPTGEISFRVTPPGTQG